MPVKYRNDRIVLPMDRVRDPLDGELRTVQAVVGSTVYLEDGGIMGLDECEEVYLPSEEPSND